MSRRSDGAIAFYYRLDRFNLQRKARVHALELAVFGSPAASSSSADVVASCISNFS
jgi:hypothetical protein